ncbi:hypothetical protein AAF712_010144 [Marasmius tenuissimus]|uniref:Uncharacterized protein n=1 Tax=Marasmius tenuissimus TaxID=585030 RepID=A0ABR2ZNT4_9AGAR
MKRRRQNTALSNRVSFRITREDDEPIYTQAKGGSYDEMWNEAKAQLRRTFEMLMQQRPRLFNSKGPGLFSEIPLYDSSAPDDDEWSDFQPAIGDEGFINSNAGGEFSYNNFLNSLLSEAPRRADMRDRHYRTEEQTQGWTRQMPRLVDAYLKFQHNGLPPEDELEGEQWRILLIDFEDYKRDPGIYSVREAETPNETLARFGLLGGSPEQPTVAFPFLLLETFRQIHRVCPRFSINQLSRVLTNIHGRFPTPSLEDQLRVAYDAYLAIQREVQLRVDRALGRDPVQHFVRNVCPPCLYQLENEAPLKPSILLAMDGNNSLKMVDTEKRSGRARLDTRHLNHPRWLDAATVDVFKDEVADSHRLLRAKTAAPTPDSGPTSACDGPEFNQDEVAWLDINEVEGLEECADTCVERWKAAGPDANKRMYSFFAISGIFLSVCRHGHVLVICDMRRSGELMKYPLAIVKELLDRYGKDIGLGYDIMCAFYKTLLRSPQLGSRVIACRLKGVVPAFHGHAHNRKCQVSWHPMYTEGVGLEDFEECERTFSESNHLAATTRLSTEFHRHQSILEHFDFHDVDKHMTSGNFIYQNYRQALERIATDGPLFLELCEQYGLSEDDCERLLQDETKHLTREVEESPELATRLDYVEMLQKLAKHKTSSDEAQAKYKDAMRSHRTSRKQETALQTRARTALERYKSTLEDLLDFENDNSYYKRWEPTDTEYQETVKAMRGRNYRQALDKLEKLVVQRLLELTKLNMSGVGYKQREKISQALRARAKAIQKALDAYNEAARTMDPPRQILDWKDILDMATVADFDLLKDTDLDLAHVPWAQPGPRECTRLYFGLKRAREEIARLNIEIPRLVSFMIDDHADHHHAVNRAREADDLDLAAELEYRMDVGSEINGHIAIRLVQTSELEGFTGTLLPGERTGRDPVLTDSAPLPSWASVVLGLTRNAGALSVQGPQTDLSHILSDLPDAAAPVEALLDYFERCSITFTFGLCETMQREEEHLCLRLQGEAEQRWLRLRGVKAADVDDLIRVRRVARADTCKRYYLMYGQADRQVWQLERRIRYNQRRIDDLLAKDGPKAARLTQMKKSNEDALETARKDQQWLCGIVDGLKTRVVKKKQGVRRRRQHKPSPEVAAAVMRKIAIIYPNDSNESVA